MKIELIYTEGCEKCAAARHELRVAAAAAVHDLVWREINVLDEVDYAVQLGVIALPSIAIDGQLVFASLPSGLQLQQEMARREKDILGDRCVSPKR